MSLSALYIGADMNVTYSAARLSIDETTYLNTGTCTYALTDADGEEVDSGTLAYVSASDGDYRGTIDAAVTAELEADAPYTLTVTFSQSPYDDQRTVVLRAAYRTTS